MVIQWKAMTVARLRHNTAPAALNSRMLLTRGQECPRYTGSSTHVLAQICVGFIDPVGARRVKDVEIDGVHERLGPMRHVGRNGQNFARVHDDLFAIDPEFQRAFQDVSDLLIVMAVLGHDASLLEQDASEHDVLPDHEVAAKQWVQSFDFDGTPGNVAQLGLRWRAFQDRGLERDFTRWVSCFRHLRFPLRRCVSDSCFPVERFQLLLFHERGSMKGYYKRLACGTAEAVPFQNRLKRHHYPEV